MDLYSTKNLVSGRGSSTSRPSNSKGLALVEVLVAICFATVSSSYLVVSLSQPVAETRRVWCMSHLRQLGIAQAGYQMDYEDRLVSFSWNSQTPGRSTFTDLQEQAEGATQDWQRASIQAVNIIRQRTGRDDVKVPTNWFPYPQYSNLILSDYLQSRLPEAQMLCPEDLVRLSWQEHVGTFPEGPRRTPINPADRVDVLPYSSTYQNVPASYDHYQNVENVAPDELVRRVRQGQRHDRYLVHPQSRLGGERMTQVRTPSEKVRIMDSHDRHTAAGRSPSGPLFFADWRSAQPLAFFDGSVREKFTRQSNPGWDPHRPESPDPTVIKYFPDNWERAARSSSVTQHLIGAYRWTRGGLRGTDFDGRSPHVKPQRPEGVSELIQ